MRRDLHMWWRHPPLPDRRATGARYAFVAAWLLAMLSGCRARTDVHIPRYATAAEVQSVDCPDAASATTLAIANIAVRDDVQPAVEDRAAVRAWLGTDLANRLHAALAQQRAFARLTRIEHPPAAGTDLVLTGEYDFFARFGPGPKGHIPWYGQFAMINQAWTRERIHLRVLDRAGAVIWHASFEDEHRQIRRGNDRAFVPWLADEFVLRMARRVAAEVPTARDAAIR
jgi:hypothetical protein